MTFEDRDSVQMRTAWCTILRRRSMRNADAKQPLVATELAGVIRLAYADSKATRATQGPRRRLSVGKGAASSSKQTQPIVTRPDRIEYVCGTCRTVAGNRARQRAGGKSCGVQAD